MTHIATMDTRSPHVRCRTSNDPLAQLPNTDWLDGLMPSTNIRNNFCMGLPEPSRPRQAY